CRGIHNSCADLKTFSQRLAGLHADHRRIAKGAARVAFFLLLGKAAGALKEMAVAYRYGVSDAVDAYQFTLTMASWLPVTIVGALSVVLIPVLVRTRREGPQARALFRWQLPGGIIALGVVLVVLTSALSRFLLHWAGQGLDPRTQRMTSLLMPAFAPAAVLTL